LRGRTCASVPDGNSIAMPVGTSADVPGAITSDFTANRSRPASPSRAYDGRIASGFSFLTLSCITVFLPRSHEEHEGTRIVFVQDRFVRLRGLRVFVAKRVRRTS